MALSVSAGEVGDVGEVAATSFGSPGGNAVSISSQLSNSACVLSSDVKLGGAAGDGAEVAGEGVGAEPDGSATCSCCC